jgi:hypothetical protein
MSALGNSTFSSLETNAVLDGIAQFILYAALMPEHLCSKSQPKIITFFAPCTNISSVEENLYIFGVAFLISGSINCTSGAGFFCLAQTAKKCLIYEGGMILQLPQV